MLPSIPTIRTSSSDDDRNGPPVLLFCASQHIGTIHPLAFQHLTTFSSSYINAHYNNSIMNIRPDLRGAASTLLSWLAANENADENWLINDRITIPLEPPAFFEDCVYLHELCHRMRLRRNFRGELVREGILEYIRLEGAVLSFEEFGMVVECLYQDPYVVGVAVQSVRSKFLKGGSKAVPDWEKIVEYVGKVDGKMGTKLGEKLLLGIDNHMEKI